MTLPARKVLKDALFLNAATVLGQGLAFLQALLVMRFLNPEDYGIWLGLNVLLTYAAYAHLGIEHGLGARMPYYLGQGNPDRAAGIGRTSFTLWTLAALLVSAGIAGYAFAGSHSPIEFWGLLCVSVLVLCSQQLQFHARYETSASKNFSRVSALSAVRSVAAFALVTPLAWKFGTYGVMAGTVVAFLLTLLAWKVLARPALPLGLSGDVAREIFRIGFPIMLVSLGGTLLDTLDRVVILLYLDKASLGAYGITTLATALCIGIVAQAASALSPHMAEEMGRNSKTPESLSPFLVNPTLLLASSCAILVMLTFVLFPALIDAFLPKYAGGVQALFLFTPGLYFLALTLSAGSILTLILIERRRQWIAVALQAAAVALKVGLSVWLLSRGWGIAGVAAAASIAYAAYGLAILLLCARIVIPGRSAGFLLSALTPFFAMLALFLPAWHFAGKMEMAGGLLLGLRLAIGLAVSGLIVLWLNRKTAFLRELRGLFAGPSNA